MPNLEPHEFLACTEPHLIARSEHCSICDEPESAEIHHPIDDAEIVNG